MRYKLFWKLSTAEHFTILNLHQLCRQRASHSLVQVWNYDWNPGWISRKKDVQHARISTWCYLAFCAFQSPIHTALLKIDVRNVQANKLAVECFAGELIFGLPNLSSFRKTIVTVSLFLELHGEIRFSTPSSYVHRVESGYWHYANATGLMWYFLRPLFSPYSCPIPAIMRFMGDYLMKGKQETDLIYFLLKVKL